MCHLRGTALRTAQKNWVWKSKFRRDGDSELGQVGAESPETALYMYNRDMCIKGNLCLISAFGYQIQWVLEKKNYTMSSSHACPQILVRSTDSDWSILAFCIKFSVSLNSLTQIKVCYSPSRILGVNWAAEHLFCLCTVHCSHWSLLPASSTNTLNLWLWEHLLLKDSLCLSLDFSAEFYGYHPLKTCVLTPLSRWQTCSDSSRSPR